MYYLPRSLAASIRLFDIWWTGLILDPFLLDPCIELVSERFVVVPSNLTDMEVILGLNHSGKGLEGLNEFLLGLSCQKIYPDVACKLVLNDHSVSHLIIGLFQHEKVESNAP